MKVERNKIIKIITCFLFLMSIYVLMCFLDKSNESLRFAIFVSLVIFCNCVYILYNYFGTFNNLFIWYYIIFYLFSNGQFLLILFNVPMIELSGLRWLQVSQEIRFDSLFFCTASQICLAIGALFAKPARYYNKNDILHIHISYRFKEKIKKIGIVMMVVSIPLDLNIQIKRMVQYISFGYSSEMQEASSLMGSIALFCIPGCYLVALSQLNNSWRKRYLPLLYIVIRSGLMLMAGKRGESLGCLCAVIWYIFATKKKKEKKRNKIQQFLKYVIIAYASLVVIDTIKQVRDIADRNLSMIFAQCMKSIISPSLVKDFLNELGASIRPLMDNMQYMESGIEKCVYGATFLASIIMVIPNFLRFGLYEKFSSLGWLEIERTLSKKVNVGYGIGYSLNAEMYYNFKMYGFIFAIIIGYFFSKMLTVKYNDNKEKEILEYALIPTLFSLIVITTRGSFQLVFKYLIWYILLPYILAISGEKNSICDNA